MDDGLHGNPFARDDNNLDADSTFAWGNVGMEWLDHRNSNHQDEDSGRGYSNAYPTIQSTTLPHSHWQSHECQMNHLSTEDCNCITSQPFVNNHQSTSAFENRDRVLTNQSRCHGNTMGTDSQPSGSGTDIYCRALKYCQPQQLVIPPPPSIPPPLPPLFLCLNDPRPGDTLTIIDLHPEQAKPQLVKIAPSTPNQRCLTYDRNLIECVLKHDSFFLQAEEVKEVRVHPVTEMRLSDGDFLKRLYVEDDPDHLETLNLALMFLGAQMNPIPKSVFAKMNAGKKLKDIDPKFANRSYLSSKTNEVKLQNYGERQLRVSVKQRDFTEYLVGGEKGRKLDKIYLLFEVVFNNGCFIFGKCNVEFQRFKADESPSSPVIQPPIVTNSSAIGECVAAGAGLIGQVIKLLTEFNASSQKAPLSILLQVIKLVHEAIENSSQDESSSIPGGGGGPGGNPPGDSPDDGPGPPPGRLGDRSRSKRSRHPSDNPRNAQAPWKVPNQSTCTEYRKEGLYYDTRDWDSMYELSDVGNMEKLTHLTNRVSLTQNQRKYNYFPPSRTSLLSQTQKKSLEIHPDTESGIGSSLLTRSSQRDQISLAEMKEQKIENRFFEWRKKQLNSKDHPYNHPYDPNAEEKLSNLQSTLEWPDVHFDSSNIKKTYEWFNSIPEESIYSLGDNVEGSQTKSAVKATKSSLKQKVTNLFGNPFFNKIVKHEVVYEGAKDMHDGRYSNDTKSLELFGSEEDPYEEGIYEEVDKIWGDEVVYRL